MQETLLKIDYWIFELINQKGAFDFGDQFFPWVTDLHHTAYFKFLVIPFLLFFFIKYYKKSGPLLFLFLALSAGWSDYAGSVVKNHYMRLRPFENPEIVATQKSPAGSKSFYSNHTSTLFDVATFTGNFVPLLKIPLFIIAGIVGYSRMYNGVHYPSDVLAGALMGILWGSLFTDLARRALKLIASRKEKL